MTGHRLCEVQKLQFCPFYFSEIKAKYNKTRQDVKGMKFRYKSKTKLKDLFAVHEVTLCRLSVIYGYSIVLYKISLIYNTLQCLTLTG